MKKRTGIWLFAAALLIIAGLIMFTAVMSVYNWDFTKLSTEKYETHIYEISEEFSRISVNTDTTDIAFVLSEDGKCRVECYEEETAKHFAAVEGNSLVIRMLDEKIFKIKIGLFFDLPKITVYLPKAEYAELSVKETTGDIIIPQGFEFDDIDISLSTGDVDLSASASEAIKIETSTGSIRITGISAGSLALSSSTGGITVSDVSCRGDIGTGSSTGKMNLSDISCKNLISVADTGDIVLKNVIASEKFFIKRSTGDVNFDGADAAEILIETDTGDITGTLLSKKIFIVETDTGNIDVPKSISGGKCEITSNTGDIRINIQ